MDCIRKVLFNFFVKIFIFIFAQSSFAALSDQEWDKLNTDLFNWSPIPSDEETDYQPAVVHAAQPSVAQYDEYEDNRTDITIASEANNEDDDVIYIRTETLKKTSHHQQQLDEIPTPLTSIRSTSLPTSSIEIKSIFYEGGGTPANFNQLMPYNTNPVAWPLPLCGSNDEPFAVRVLLPEFKKPTAYTTFKIKRNAPFTIYDPEQVQKKRSKTRKARKN